MPKQSKIRSTRATSPTPIQDDNREYYCCTCGKKYKKQYRNFPTSQSPLFRGNNGYMTTCRNCVDELFLQYKNSIGSEKEALKRICMKFDIYWNDDVYGMVNKASTTNSRVLAYISRTNLVKHQGKTFDDTLDEEYANNSKTIQLSDFDDDDAFICGDLDEEQQIDKATIRFWGPGLPVDMYIELNDRYEYWLSKYPEDTILDAGEEAILRQICNIEVEINRDRATGKSIDKNISALNNLLGSANLKPTQKKEAENIFVPFGVEIANFEREDPIIDPDPEFDDVDGIRKNITTWFLGHLAKMGGIKNAYIKEYEDEMKKYTIERPSYEEDESDTSDAIFSDSETGGESSG